MHWTARGRPRGRRSAASTCCPPRSPALEPVRRLRAAHQVFVDSAVTHRRLPFGIDEVAWGTGRRRPTGTVVAVTEEVVARTPFCTLLRFAKDLPDGAPPQPRVLLVAPMSGHFATLLAGTVRTLLPDHDVHVTDWHNARDVPVAHGPFGLDEMVDHVIEFLQVLGPRSHVVAVCQPCVPVLAAVALMAEDRHIAQPASMTLMAGPVDVEVGPTPVNALARAVPPEVFRDALVTAVPPPHAGAGRLVYPGFLQLTGFVAMNPQRHLDAHVGLFEALVAGDLTRARATREFYDEYLAVADLPAEVYLDTIEQIFREQPARPRRAHLARPPGAPRADHPDRAAHGRGRARRHLRAGADDGRARAVPAHPRLPPPAPPAAGGRALRGVQRAPVGGPGRPVVRGFIAANS